MFGDTSYYIQALCYLVAMGILVVAAYRGLRIRTGLASPIYRSRALSLALVAVLYTIALISDLYPYPQTTDLDTAALITLVNTLPYFLFAFLMFRSVDRTVLVANDMDLLGRNTLQWPRLRWPLYALALGAISLILVAGPFLYLQTPPAWANTADLAFYPLFLTALGVSAVALFLSSRRSLEKAMGRFVTFFGVAVAFFITDFILFNYVYYFYYTPELQFVDDLVIVAASYFLYRAITSLTPLGRVEG